jgi:hypothetical protein
VKEEKEKDKEEKEKEKRKKKKTKKRTTKNQKKTATTTTNDDDDDDDDDDLLSQNMSPNLRCAINKDHFRGTEKVTKTPVGSLQPVFKTRLESQTCRTLDRDVLRKRVHKTDPEKTKKNTSKNYLTTQ